MLPGELRGRKKPPGKRLLREAIDRREQANVLPYKVVPKMLACDMFSVAIPQYAVAACILCLLAASAPSGKPAGAAELFADCQNMFLQPCFAYEKEAVPKKTGLPFLFYFWISRKSISPWT